MSSIVEYFLAASDAEAAQPGLSGSSPSKAGSVSAELRGIDPIVTLATLEEAITGRSATTIIEAATQTILQDGRNGVWVSRVRDMLVDGLDGTDQSLADIARKWASSDELRGVATGATLLGAVESLQTLARRARRMNLGLYCWMEMPLSEDASTVERLVVIFNCDTAAAAAIDVAAGPWKLRRSMRRVVSRRDASIGTLDDLSFVYGIVSNPNTQQPSLTPQRNAEGATLALLAPAFVNGLATLHDDELPGSARRPRRVLTDPVDMLNQQWIHAQRANLETSVFADRLARWRDCARVAGKHGEGVYCWYGPPIERRD